MRTPLISAALLALLLSPLPLRAVPPSGTATITPTATPTPVASPTVTQTQVCGSTFGCAACTPAAPAGVHGSAVIYVSQFNLASSGTVYEIQVDVSGTAGQSMVGGIYSNNGGNPSALLIQSGTVTNQFGWTVIPIPPTYFASGTYWLAICSSAGLTELFSTSIAGMNAGIMDTTFGPLPNAAPAFAIGPQNFMISASYCPGPPYFFTPTPTPTASPTPLQYSAAPQGKLAFGPVPAHKGTPLCLYFDQAPRASTWEVFNLHGQVVSTLSFGLGEQACWDTTAIAPGLYLVRAKVNYSGGGNATVMQKVVVLK